MRRTSSQYELSVDESGVVRCPRMSTDTDAELCYSCGNFAGTARRNSHRIVRCAIEPPHFSLFSDICDVLGVGGPVR